MDMDHADSAGQVWDAMSRDPALLDGLTMGQLEVLAAAVTTILSQPQVQRSIPIATAKKITEGATDSSLASQLELIRLCLRIPAVKLRLDMLSDRSAPS